MKTREQVIEELKSAGNAHDEIEKIKAALAKAGITIDL